MRRIRFLTVLAAAVLVASFPLNTSAGTPRLVPRDAADWATFTPAEQTSALAYQQQLLEKGLRLGTVETLVVLGQAAAVPGKASPMSLSITYTCGFIVHTVAGGRWVGGGGYVDTNDYVYYLYASRSGKQGQLFRDGQLNKNWYQEMHNATHAEAWSDQDFSWSWEHPTYVVKGWFGVEEVIHDVYQLGPDQYCTHTYTP